ncbi:hypothetical protein [Ferruginibacter sp.]|jgi:hypothetical protein|uniref:hypothetical protein n=1 Tax=Ferruginibacter sp. TaxID=1940288 RepID=UPI0019B865A0|nr:hypothetical protein [Ferruginibacter sp.]MBC7627202.1 hypothetical protein [Ferruginibacter sp.]
MNINYRDQIPDNFSPASRVWIYQCSRLFFLSEALQVEEILEQFVSNWKSHGATVQGYGNLFFGQFIVLMADESEAGVSGCSTDSSVHIIKEIEKLFKVDLFNRQTLAFIIKDKVQLLPLTQLNYAVENNFINGSSIYFNNIVTTKKELLESWLIPVKDSWLSKKINHLLVTGIE